MARTASLVAVLGFLVGAPSHAEAPSLSNVRVNITGVLADNLKQAVNDCDPAVKKAAQVARVLGLPAAIVAPDTTCHFDQGNLQGNGDLDDIFNFATPTVNGSRYQTVAVFSPQGERLGLYHAMNLPLTEEVIDHGDGSRSLLQLDGHGTWLGQPLHWSGLFRIESGKFVAVPDASGQVAPPPRCPNDHPVPLEQENGISEGDLQAVACTNERCTLGCIDSQDPVACRHEMSAYWLGSFSKPDSLDALVALRSNKDPAGLPRHGSYLVLLRATPCGWVKLSSVPDFVGDDDTCHQQRVGERDVLVCQQNRGPLRGGVIESTLGIYSVHDDMLHTEVPFHTEPLPACHPGQLLTSRISDLAFDEADEQGVVPLTVTVVAAHVTWTPRKGTDGETCQDATARLTDAMKQYSIHLELSQEGARLPTGMLQELKSHPVPGLELR